MPYSRDGLNHSKVEPATTGGSAMIVFLSLPNLTSKYRRVIATLEERGLTVVTNFDWSGPEVLVIRSDRRRELIQQSDAYVYFSTPNHPLVREIEFGYAIGLGLPVAFVGEPKTQMHGYGDVFDDTDDFLAGWYSGDYLRQVATITQLREREKAIA